MGSSNYDTDAFVTWDRGQDRLHSHNPAWIHARRRLDSC